MMRRALIGAALLVACASPASAQSIPDVGRAIGAARNAAAATDVHTARMTSEPATQAGRTPPRAPATVRRGAAARDSAATTTPPHAAAGEARPRSGGSASGVETFRRETFSYEREGRRDPFVSLMTTSELRPLISDLKLVAIAFDPQGVNSVAVLRDLNTKEQYRVKLGQLLGRMRVARISPKSVAFTVEEFGFSRQEVIDMGDQSQARKK